MTTFTIIAANQDGEEKRFTYDNMTSELLHEDGTPVVAAQTGGWSWGLNKARAMSVDEPAPKLNAIRTLKIQLGLSCNYSCEYCSQRFVPHADSTNPSDVPRFMAQLQEWFDGGEDGEGAGVRVEFWGGEPFVYWKTLKPLAEAIKARYPNVRLSTITNGSLLDDEKVEWLDKMGFSVGISHDGPGQPTRGPDPFDDPVAAAGILKLLRTLGPSRSSINAMLHKDNASRRAILDWMTEKVGSEVEVGEGAFIDPYDEGGLQQSAPDGEWMVNYARQAFVEMRAEDMGRFSVVKDRINGFVNSIITGRRGETLGQKCGMDDPRNIAIDLNGNVLTCQNVSATSVAPNGKPHKIGHVSDMNGVKLNTATHWSKREDCPSCPVLQLCKGGCMFLEGERWDAGCDNAFIDSWPFFAAGIEALTDGYVPHTVIGGRKDRETPFHHIPKRQKKTIPIFAAK